MGYLLMRGVKVFLARQYNIPKFKIRLFEHGIQLHQKESDCDTALVIFGDFTNPLVFKKKKVLAYYRRNNDVGAWYLLFSSLYKPILDHYYDEIIMLPQCSNYVEMADNIAKEVKRLQNETD